MKMRLLSWTLLLTVTQSLAYAASPILSNVDVGFIEDEHVGGSLVEYRDLMPMDGFNEEIRWGVIMPGQPDKSGFGILPETGLPKPVALNTIIPIAEFTHFNNIITVESSIESALFSVDFDIDFSMYGGGTESFGYQARAFLEETENAEPCDPSGATVCPDIVTLDIPNSSLQTSQGGQLFTVTLEGFGCSVLVDEFITEEQQPNSISIVAVITSEPVPIPEPSTYLLLGSILLPVAARARRRKHQS